MIMYGVEDILPVHAQSLNSGIVPLDEHRPDVPMLAQSLNSGIVPLKREEGITQELCILSPSELRGVWGR
jgi:hypothetical protein